MLPSQHDHSGHVEPGLLRGCLGAVPASDRVVQEYQCQDGCPGNQVMEGACFLVQVHAGKPVQLAIHVTVVGAVNELAYRM